jgi:hypothetical protein
MGTRAIKFLANALKIVVKFLPVYGSDNEPSGVIRCSEFLQKVSNWQHLKDDSSSFSYWLQTPAPCSHKAPLTAYSG